VVGVKVVVEAGFNRRADCELGAGEQFQHSLRHQMCGAVAKGVQARVLLLVKVTFRDNGHYSLLPRLRRIQPAFRAQLSYHKPQRPNQACGGIWRILARDSL
jgi:hypothetical protein